MSTVPAPEKITMKLRILIIRNDNIGDLVCTTPLFAALRAQWPQSWIGVLANTYNAPILNGNPDIDEVFSYCKAKHRTKGTSLWSIWFGALILIWKLRRRRITKVLCASPGAFRLARWLGARRVVDIGRTGNGHEVEITFRLLAELGLNTSPGPLVLSVDDVNRYQLQKRLGLTGHSERRIGLHISARKPQQRWPVARFAELARQVLNTGHGDCILLFWAPGADTDALHPGDDDNASKLSQELAELPVVKVPTTTLVELATGLSLVDIIICCDGGAMHIAAGLGKPIVCLFGNSSANRWHPWLVPHRLLQKPSQNVSDIEVHEVIQALHELPNSPR
jgi:heptosyltransferase-3